MPYDLFLGVPRHRAPDVVLASGMAENGYVPVDSRTLETRFPTSTRLATLPLSACRRRGCLQRERRGLVAESIIARVQGASGHQRPTGGAAPATSSSVPAASAAWTWISFLGQGRPARIKRPPWSLCAEKEDFGQAVAPAGSTHRASISARRARLAAPAAPRPARCLPLVVEGDPAADRLDLTRRLVIGPGDVAVLGRGERRGVALVGADRPRRAGRSSSMFTSSRGRYQRVGKPVSNRASGRSDSASVSPSSVTFTCRELRFTSMR